VGKSRDKGADCSGPTRCQFNIRNNPKFQNNNNKQYSALMTHAHLMISIQNTNTAISTWKTFHVLLHTVYFGLHKVFLSIFNTVTQLCSNTSKCENMTIYILVSAIIPAVLWATGRCKTCNTNLNSLLPRDLA